ncbi:MAG: hypothetical protein H6867_09180 [Rhodospirillales bacterium]|nr:hypothetical protein [Rhodospirillales bacterium]MCB9996027.1 hypothetical protein [Rhodospirillales bacterium]
MRILLNLCFFVIALTLGTRAAHAFCATGLVNGLYGTLALCGFSEYSEDAKFVFDKHDLIFYGEILETKDRLELKVIEAIKGINEGDFYAVKIVEDTAFEKFRLWVKKLFVKSTDENTLTLIIYETYDSYVSYFHVGDKILLLKIGDEYAYRKGSCNAVLMSAPEAVEKLLGQLRHEKSNDTNKVK